MEFRQVKYFLVLAEHRNFTRAAGVLHIAQPTLSQQIAELERSLDVKLLERTSRSVELTAAGQAFLVEAVQLQAQYYRCLRAVDGYRTGESGRLTLATLDTFESTFLPDFFGLFCREHPDVSLTHVTGSFREIHEMLLSHTVDVGVNLVPAFDTCPELVGIPVNRDRLVLAAADTPERHGMVAFDDPRMEGLLAGRCILWSGWYNSEPVLELLRARSPAFSCVVLENVSTVLMRALGENGYTILPDIFLDSFRTGRPMLRIPLPEPYSALDVLLLRHRENTNPCALRFLQEAKDYLARTGLTALRNNT